LVSGSNCCRPKQIHLFQRRADGSFAERAEVRIGETKAEDAFPRGVALPHLVDWDRDGHTDLVVGYGGSGCSWTLHVGLGPFADKKDLTLKPANLPPIRDTLPVHFGFADWDGDGRMDLLAGGEGPRRLHPDGVGWRGRGSVYWFRNTTDTGPPKFAEAAHLLDIPEAWELRTLTAVDWGEDGSPSLVVSVTKGYRRDTASPVSSELWLYQRKAELGAAPDRGGK
jgi:hypothetical protein